MNQQGLEPQPTESSYRFIVLTRGKFARVDAVDSAWLSQWIWTAIKGRNNWYAVRSAKDPLTGKKKNVLMHRAIINAPAGMMVDHADLNGLNNSRSNIRLATIQQNNANRGLQKNNTTGFKGIQLQPCGWTAKAKVDGRLKYLGVFKTAEEAGECVANFCRSRYGEFSGNGSATQSAKPKEGKHQSRAPGPKSEYHSREAFAT